MIEQSAKRVIVTGSTGFIGRALCPYLIDQGYEVIGLTRNVESAQKRFKDGVEFLGWDGKGSEGWGERADGALAIINLAGENISSGLWTSRKKEKILISRRSAGQAVMEAVRAVHKRPQVLIQASAVGFYAPVTGDLIDESSPSGKGFLSDVCRKWEGSTADSEALGVRRIIIRSGLVLGPNGGILKRLKSPFRFFAGGPLGRGDRWLSWIHLQDELRAIGFLLKESSLSGVFNLTSPQPVSAKDFCQSLGKAMKRPCWIPVPGPILEIIFGQLAREALLSSQQVIPRRLVRAGFEFRFSGVGEALEDLIGER